MPSTTTGARARRAVPRLSTAALAAAIVLTGCAGGADVEAGGEDDRFISGDGSATVFEADERDPIPEVSGTTLDDDELSLSEYRGEILVLNFWASWCGPCRAEQPVFNEIQEEYTDLGVDFLGVNIKDNRTSAEAYITEMGVDYPSLYDQPGEIPQTFRDTVPPRAIPSTLVIDPDGAIAARIIGPTTYGQFTELLNPLVVEYDFGDPEERPRVAEREAEEEAEEGEEETEEAEETESEATDEAERDAA